MTKTAKCQSCNGTGQAPLSSIFLDVLRAMPKAGMTSANIARNLKIKHDNACKRLAQLHRLGLIVRTGTACNYRYSKLTK